MGFLPRALAVKLILHQILCSIYRVPCPWEDRQQNTEDLPRKPIALAAPPEPGEKLLPCCAPPQDRPAPAQAITGTFPAHTPWPHPAAQAPRRCKSHDPLHQPHFNPWGRSPSAPNLAASPGESSLVGPSQPRGVRATLALCPGKHPTFELFPDPRPCQNQDSSQFLVFS